jgi:hypothetical protein
MEQDVGVELAPTQFALERTVPGVGRIESVQQLARVDAAEVEGGRQA